MEAVCYAECWSTRNLEPTKPRNPRLAIASACAGWDPKTLVLSNLTILLGRHFFEFIIVSSPMLDVYADSCHWLLFMWFGSELRAGPEDLLGKAPPEAPIEAPTSPEVSWFINTMTKRARKIWNMADLRVLPLTFLSTFCSNAARNATCLIDSYRKSSALHGRSLHWWNETLVRQQRWCWDTQHWPIHFPIFI